MMSTTHAAAGTLLAIPLLVFAPHLAPLAALAAVVGGVFPDLDVFVGVHRKTLHFPVYYSALGAAAAALAALAPGPATVAAAAFLLSAGLHSASDVLGGGDDLRPWERRSSRAVYVHPLGRWFSPRFLIRYDGAPEDLALLAVLSVPGLLLFGPLVRRLTLVGLVVGAVYTAFRKRMPDVVGL